MTNAEKYRKEILKILENNHSTSIGIKNGYPYHCYDLGCGDCDWRGSAGMVECKMNLIRWLCESPQNFSEITEQEWRFLRMLVG